MPKKQKPAALVIGEHKTKDACIVEVGECMGMRTEGSHHKNHEDHISGKGMNSLSHHNLLHKFIPWSQEMKIPTEEASVEKEWENSQKYWHDS